MLCVAGRLGVSATKLSFKGKDIIAPFQKQAGRTMTEA